ncbi:MAG: acyltransferase [Ignavibacteria bacterium]|nr:acyltransferase [Ignavibacteria bacterium]
MNSFYDETELRKIGFKKFGRDVRISRKASIYSPNKISIGDHVRIDDFCILSGNIAMGSYIHISAYTALYAKYEIQIEDFVTISGRVLVYSQSDDYSGNYMTNPMIPGKFTKVTGGKVVFKKHSIIAAGCIIFPAVIVGEGAAIGAMSLVNTNIDPWTINAGIPTKKIKDRKKKILQLEKKIVLSPIR